MNNKLIILYILFFYINYNVFAQNKKTADSLWSIWSNTSIHDTMRLNAIDELAWYYQTFKNDSAIIIGEIEMKYANKMGYKKWESSAYNTIGLGYLNKEADLKKEEEEKVFEYFNKSLSIRTEMNDENRMAAVIGNIGVAYANIYNDYSIAISYYLKSLKLYEKTNNKKGQAIAKFNLGFLYSRMKDHKNAIAQSLGLLKIAEELNDEYLYSVAYPAIADNYLGLKKHNDALFYANKGLEFGNKIKNQNMILDILPIKIRLYIDQNKINEAIEVINITKSIAQEISDTIALANVELYSGEINLKQQNFQNAIKHYLASLNYIYNNSDKDVLISNIYLGLYKSYQALNDYKNALFYYQKNISYIDSINKINNINELRNIELKYNYDKKAATDSIKSAEQKKVFTERLEKEKTQRFTLYGGIIFAIIFAGFIFNRLKASQKQKQIIEKQKEIVEEKQKEITDSITYAKRIQYLLLANEQFIKKHLPNHFIFYNPKDIVSGDFYWATENNNGFYLAICDCTGHGVPGAFMSLLNISFLNEAINEKNISEPHLVLNYIRERIVSSMEGSNDGMDATLVKFEKNKITYASANNKPILIQKNRLIELATDKMPVGKGENKQSFNLYTIECSTNDTIYFFTDGYADQFGGTEGKKFKYKKLKELLLKISNEPMHKQKQILEQAFNEWKGNLEQVDDVCVIGIKI